MTEKSSFVNEKTAVRSLAVFCFITFIWNSKKNYVNFEFVGVERIFVFVWSAIAAISLVFFLFGCPVG